MTLLNSSKQLTTHVTCPQITLPEISINPTPSSPSPAIPFLLFNHPPYLYIEGLSPAI